MQRECAWRLFTDSNKSFINSWTYGIESAFHERLLQASSSLNLTQTQRTCPPNLVLLPCLCPACSCMISSSSASFSRGRTEYLGSADNEGSKQVDAKE